MKAKLITLLAFTLVGCSQQRGMTDAELVGIRGDISYLKREAEMLSEFRQETRSRLSAIENSSTEGTWAIFDPAGGKGYQYIATNVSPILMSFVDSSSIGDGTKIRLRIGNVSSATYTGVRLTIRYNTRVPQEPSSVPAWNEATKEVVRDEVTELPAGSWAETEVSLPGIKPDSLGHVAVQAHLDNLKLRTSQ